MIVSKHGTAQEAWEWANEILIREEKKVLSSGGYRTGNNMMSYDNFLDINKLWVDPEFDFGYMFGYKPMKWNILVRNYIDFDFLDMAKSQVQIKEDKKTYQYSIGFKFSNKHNSGHGCLLSMVFSRRYTQDNPIILLNIRSSEVTKRLLMDFVLVQRIVEYVYGKDVSASIKVYIGNMYISAEHFTMYNNYKDLSKLLESNDSILAVRTLKLMDKYKGMDPETITYKVHRRAVRRVNKVETTPLLAKDLQLV